MKYETHIDTLEIQLDCNTSQEQNSHLEDIRRLVRESMNLYIDFEKKGTIAYRGSSKKADVGIYKIYHLSTKLATIETGFASKSRKFYVSVKFAGLKTYHTHIDEASVGYLLKLCSYFNVNAIKFKITEVDIAIDVRCKFEHILTVCTRHAPSTDYYILGARQKYKTNTWIEKIKCDNLEDAILRTYVYDKKVKDLLDFEITRTEFKFQKNFFSKNGLNYEQMRKTMDRYHIMYFDDLGLKKTKVNKYNGYKKVLKRQVKQLKFDDFRLKADISYVQKFIENLFSVTSYHEMDVKAIKKQEANVDLAVRGANTYIQNSFLKDCDFSRLKY